MVTRWKKFSRSPVLKFLAFALTALVALGGLVMTVHRLELSDVYTQHAQYTDSPRYANIVASALNDCGVVSQEGQVYGEIHYEYLVRMGDNTWTNSERDLDKVARTGGDWVYHYQDGELIVPENTPAETREIWYSMASWSGADEIIVAMDTSYMEQQAAVYQQDYTFVQQWEHIFWYVVAALVLLTVYLLAVAGRTGRDNELHLLFVDRWPTEILVGSEAILALMLLMALLITSDSVRGGQAQALMAIDLMIGLMGLTLLLSLARKAKAGRLWSDSALRYLFKGISWLCRGETWRVSGRVGKRAVNRLWWTGMLCMALCIVLSLFLYAFFGYRLMLIFTVMVLGMVCIAGMIYLLVMQAKDGRELDALADQVEAAASGQATHPTLPEESPLHKTSAQIARLDAGVKESLAASLKSERMKVELITNVSHDLKTPLTSIIGYLDLLEKQSLPPEAEDYVKILRKKSERLSHTVNDLFTLSKATSGEEAVVLEPLDLVMAVNQTLADMSDAVEKAGIPVRTTLPESAWVFAENRRLYRVLQNILDNALRYSLQGTRIYLEISSQPDKIFLSLTNTAGYEMDFTEEEILQRFVRGDKARTTEGSGLGLSIAESFMDSFGGRLSVSIHGDAFTVSLAFAAAPAQKETQPEEET